MCDTLMRLRKPGVSGSLLTAPHPLPRSCLCTASGLASRAALLLVVEGVAQGIAVSAAHNSRLEAILTDVMYGSLGAFDGHAGLI